MITENDLQLLEEYLDGELSAEESDRLQIRIKAESELAVALDQMRQQRSLRRQAWQGMEPTAVQVDQLLDRVRSTARRRELWHRPLRALRFVSAAAACLVLGLIIGRYGKSPAPVLSPVTDSAVVRVQNPGTSNPRFYDVQLTDSKGQVVAVQRFNTAEEAREFTEDLRRLQQRPDDVRDDHVVTASEEKF